ncbi:MULTISPECIES: MFS transporter [Ralstonia]|uniref:Proline porter II n=1 Tax=Ralstonia mannitolilytica TaxID=105219 RepID=A0AAJ4ZN25_9RALS|nr:MULTISPECIES: MFS transporter [Ralstonia]AJW43467.1 citrate-proton symporter [Ralstonia mannitolilytica]MBU9581077.1 MFS transporter [Ralstonia mannitolilytica]PLT20363.1 MFS transporter [Ralstonia mannitolilytica]QIF08689.1 MFS transporter [Ralstonia mannitolilytica]CAG2152802.1 Proline/betaine transporter [Ralstonia mannitolilytica]
MHTHNPNESKARAIFRVVSGNFLEMYDFMVYGYYAKAIADTFFPAGNEFLSLMLSLVTFGAGFLMRPLGAIFLGAYIDRHGRRAGLILTLALMACGTLLIAAVPSYASIGLAAPLLVLIGRLLQGFSAGVELGGVSVYLAEIATPGRKGFFVSWQSGSQQVAVMFAALLGVLLSLAMPPTEVSAWGWRIPFVVGCLIVPFLFIIRRSLRETEEFEKRKHRPDMAEVFRSMVENWRLVGAGTLLVVMTTVSFYLITAYTPTFGKSVLHLSDMDSLIVTLCVGASNLFWLPVMGAVSDRVGRRPLLILFTVLMLLTAYPAMVWLVGAPSFARLLAVELWLSFLYGSYNGAMVVTLTEIMPPAVRTTGFSLAYSLATAIFGGFTPAIATWLIHATGNKAMPGVWVSFAALCGLIATLAVVKPAGKHVHGAATVS